MKLPYGVGWRELILGGVGSLAMGWVAFVSAQPHPPKNISAAQDPAYAITVSNDHPFPGEVITVRGKGWFTPDTKWCMGGFKPASITYVSPTEVRLQIPFLGVGQPCQ